MTQRLLILCYRQELITCWTTLLVWCLSTSVELYYLLQMSRVTTESLPPLLVTNRRPYGMGSSTSKSWVSPTRVYVVQVGCPRSIGVTQSPGWLVEWYVSTRLLNLGRLQTCRDVGDVWRKGGIRSHEWRHLVSFLDVEKTCGRFMTTESPSPRPEGHTCQKGFHFRPQFRNL